MVGEGLWSERRQEQGVLGVLVAQQVQVQAPPPPPGELAFSNGERQMDWERPRTPGPSKREQPKGFEQGSDEIESI